MFIKKEIDAAQGKYTFYLDERSTVRCDRWGELFKIYDDDKAVLALFESHWELQIKYDLLKKEKKDGQG